MNLRYSPFGPAVTAGLISWVAISLGFFGLKMLMQERPEFVGQPMRLTRAELVQDSPQIVVRKVDDDILVIKPAQPEFSDVRIDMKGRRDYRGLRTIMDMSGEFRARYTLTNAFAEPIFVLFKCAHPRTESGDSQTLPAAELRLQTSANGDQENTKDAWFWSGTIEARGSAVIEISYQCASLKGVSYRVGDQTGNQIRHLRVAFHRQDIPSIRFESGDGFRTTLGETVVWQRQNFLAPDFFSAQIVESRNLFASLAQLLEIGPVVCLLFLLTVLAVVLTRQRLTSIQTLTIAAGYAIYFPLILYLSSRFSFVVALVIAFVVPGALLLNYARWLLGSKLGLLGGLVILLLFQVFPTLAAFAGWNRGMLLLCLGIVTLWVLINLQNQALKRKASIAGLAVLCAFQLSARAGEVQVLLPIDLASNLSQMRRETTNAIIAYESAQYHVREEASFFLVEARVGFEIARVGDLPAPLLGAPVHLRDSHIESSDPDLARLVTLTNRLALFVRKTGLGSLRLSYRVPIDNREGKKRVQIPLLAGPSGEVRLESAHSDLEVLTGSLWTTTVSDKLTVYEIGVAGEDLLVIEWRGPGDSGPLGPGSPAASSREFYGIGLTRAQNLTVINSDGSCTHFAEFQLPAFQTEEFRLRLPAKARLISVSVNGNEISSPIIEDQLCRIRLPSREVRQTAHHLSFRISYPTIRLGFVGTVELTLPEVFQTTGTLEWVLSLPNGFETQVISSGLETQKAPADLERFGDYGRISKSRPHIYLAKDLAPPGSVGLSLKYRQVVPGLFDPRSE